MILDYTKPFPKSFETKSEELFFNLIVISDKLYSSCLKDTDLWQVFNKTFRELLVESINDNFYWQYCPPKVYIAHYKERETEFIEKNKLLNALAFAKREKDYFSMMLNNNSYSFMYKVIKDGGVHYKYSAFGFEINYLRNVELLPFLKVSTQNKIQLLDQIISSFFTENPHPRYFKGNSFAIFEMLKDKIVQERSKLADYSFIYRQMQKDGFIYEDIKEGAFRDWLLKENDIELGFSLKTLNECSTPHKLISYSEILSTFK